MPRVAFATLQRKLVQWVALGEKAGTRDHGLPLYRDALLITLAWGRFVRRERPPVCTDHRPTAQGFQ